MRTLSSGANYTIVEEGPYVRVTVVNRPEISPEEGARCATEMSRVLEELVLVTRARYRGVLFDVRRGPMAFGPKTRTVLVGVFAAARRAEKRIAVRVDDSPTKRMQFGVLCSECAAGLAKVFEDDGDRLWLTG